MRLLFVVPYAPTPIRSRPYYLLRELRSRGHEVTLLTLVTEPAEEPSLQALRDLGVTVMSEPLRLARSLVNSAVALPTQVPLQARYCWQPALAARLERLLSVYPAAYDVVHVEHLRGSPYALRAKDTPGGPPVVWDSVDCISHLFRQAAVKSRRATNRWIARLELGRTEQFEANLVWRFDRVLVTSEVDRQALLDLGERARRPNDPLVPPVSVLANGVDLDYFCPDPNARRDPATLVLSGKMSYHANVTMVLNMVREVMPIVWQRRPEVRLVVAGKDPGREIRSLGADERIEVTGYVADLRPYLRRATAAVAPAQYAAGIQNKVLEAMACGTPVIAAPPAVSALNTEAGRELLVVASPADMADQILSLLDQPERREAIAVAGRRYVEAHHDWGGIAAFLEGIYETVRLGRVPSAY